MFLLGTFLAYLVYRKDFALNTYIQKNFSFVYNLSFNKWYIDEIYFWFLNRIIMPIYKIGWSLIDKVIIDGLFVNGISRTTSLVGSSLRLVETGRGQLYVLVIFSSVLFGILFLLNKG